ncbi:PREDICTED: ubiquitin-like protein 4B [Miniopterus natalensis]|uniref:ubiquitin-like protein 4B n=1 Tax=Miniopterus natalensis TaxID=291302 RepID=UPI0007A6AF2A|nr:PREDICTED: ubiquitin-like protein 4B [Miniopterus natalensis]
MFLTVKLLLGRRCSVKVSGQESVAALKKLVSERLQVPEEQQHLLFRGQLLADDKRLCDYCIGPNASINVIIRPLEKTEPQEALQARPLWHQLGLVLAKHFGPQDAEAVLRLVRQEHQEALQRISLGHLEQLARDFLTEEPLVELAGEREPEAEASATGDKQEEGDREGKGEADR